MTFWRNWFRRKPAISSESPPELPTLPFDVVTVAGKDALVTLDRLRSEGKGGGIFPSHSWRQR
jgi:hypothetical protein